MVKQQHKMERASDVMQRRQIGFIRGTELMNDSKSKLEGYYDETNNSVNYK
jgi:hypothetical protein